ncbi:MAG: ribosomal protein S12 methylthiotransferase RimO [Deltaproteobacteria bacterium RBG_16_49_23]|nr:MAG: ribosomal protein S12 methylthiotransferase RimO [Deltaproteobacteria bacterium RBG_16_49_23]
MKETVCLVSLGCPKNLVDSEVTLGLLSKEGYALTTDPSKGDVIIVNTCSFIKDAVQEAIETILQLTPYKREGRCRLLIVSGCLPQRYGRILEKELPEVDLFVGTGSFHKIPRLISRGGKRKSFLSGQTFLYNEKTPRILSTPAYTAYLKIAEGCSRTCTFCTVPKIRGPYRSRTIRSILKEAEKLAYQGVKELILIAQDTTAYGEDLRGGATLENLLKDLVRVEGLRWIRILYAYPNPARFTESLLQLIGQEGKICPYLDLPIQHIDDKILRRMGRRSKGKEIRDLIQKIRSSVPEMALRTSLIVGFPGESESQFKALLHFVEEVQFDHLGAFKYSPEEGTPASRLSSPVPEEVKEERLRILMEVQKKISLKKYRKMVGRKMEALVEEANSERMTLRGRIQTQAPEIDGCVFLKGEALPGDWVEVRITRALSYDLIGVIDKILP